MVSSRVYVPSRALLRALSRPVPPSCPFARPVAAQFLRGKRTKAAKSEEDGPISTRPLSAEKIKLVEQIEQMTSKMDADDGPDDIMRPLSDKEIESNSMPTVNWYELDLDKGSPRRLIQKLETKEDWKRDQETFRMMLESQKAPDYDNAALNRRLIDSLISNPNFADLTQELKDIKQKIKTKEELQALDELAEKEAALESQEFSASLRMATHQALQDLIDDPDVGDARKDLQELQRNIPEVDDLENPDFQAALQKAMARLEGNAAFQEKLAAMADETGGPDLDKEWHDLEGKIEKIIDEVESENADPDAGIDLEAPGDLQDLDLLLLQMRDVLKSIGADKDLEAELDAVLSEDPAAPQEGDLDREMDAEELADEIKKLAHAQSKMPPVEDVDEEEDIPADLQAKVDKIMEDPKLLEKLVQIQKLISESDQAKSDLTAIAHETAPDPYELEEGRTATLKQRMHAARQTPEHVAALERLRVDLLPPFNISPALKSFNQAIELAYIGANDDIRRILWRAYQKARTLPTFLQNLSDEAWDILYYSQAVTWGSNQNRQDHLKMLLADLKRLGREGPPTHPSTLIKRDGADHIQ